MAIVGHHHNLISALAILDLHPLFMVFTHPKAHRIPFLVILILTQGVTLLRSDLDLAQEAITVTVVPHTALHLDKIVICLCFIIALALCK